MFLKIFIKIALIIVIFTNTACARNIKFNEDNITVGSCRVKVFTAKDFEQKRSGMLGFTDKTFPKEGMIFIGDTPEKHYYHTVGMKMEIRIMGVQRTAPNVYKVNNGAIYAPAGISAIEVFGDSVFEVPEKLYQSYLKDCLFIQGK